MTFVTWRWRPMPGYRSTYHPNTVTVLRNMLKRHYAKPHRFVCVTDTPNEVEKGIETLPLWKDWADIQSSHGGRNPSCFRRLKVFGPEAEQWFGPRFASVDLDTVIVRDVTPVFDRPEEFVCFGETDHRSFYNGSLFLLTAGSRRTVYDTFAANPQKARDDARAKGKFGSDQSIISNVLQSGEAIWTPNDGVYSFRVHLESGNKPLPENARLIAFHGGTDPWSPRAQRLDWVRRHYQ